MMFSLILAMSLMRQGLYADRAHNNKLLFGAALELWASFRSSKTSLCRLAPTRFCAGRSKGGYCVEVVCMPVIATGSF